MAFQQKTIREFRRRYGRNSGEFIYYTRLVLIFFVSIFKKIFFIILKILSLLLNSILNILFVFKRIFVSLYFSFKKIKINFRKVKSIRLSVFENVVKELRAVRIFLNNVFNNKKEKFSSKIYLNKEDKKKSKKKYIKADKKINIIRGLRAVVLGIKNINYFRVIKSIKSIFLIVNKIIGIVFWFFIKKIGNILNKFGDSIQKVKATKTGLLEEKNERLSFRGLFSKFFLGKKGKNIFLPLYFRWEIVLRRVSSAKKHIVGPFKKHWQYVTAVVILIVFVSTTLFMNSGHNVYAAVYNWNQSDWSGGVEELENPSHDSNQNNWGKYSSKDENMLAGEDLSLGLSSNFLTDTLADDFSAGELNNTSVLSDSLALNDKLSFTDWSTRLVGGFDTDKACGVYVLGSYAYIADYGEGLKIFDISDPINPNQVGVYDTSGYANGVSVNGDYAYVSDGVSGIKIIDISDPENPDQVGEYDTDGYSYSSEIIGDYAYLANGNAGLEILNISDPTTPVLVGNLVTYRARDVEISGNYAYVADDSESLKIINISDLSTPTLVGSLDPGSTGYGIKYSNGYVYLADSGGDLKIIDVSDPAVPVLTGEIDLDDSVYSVYVSGNYAYLATDEKGLTIVDISNPASPVFKAGVNLFSSRDIYILGDYAYIADYEEGLKIIDISNPDFLSISGETATDSARKIDILDNYAYVADYSAGLRIVNIVNPEDPILVSTFDTDGSCSEVKVVGDYAYVADSTGGLKVIDISDKNNPSLKGSLGTERIYGLYVSGNYAYIADYSSGFKIINISDPANPTIVSGSGTYRAYDVYVSGNYAYVADYSAGLKVIDISDPKNPDEVKAIDTSGSAQSIYGEGNYLYLADGSGGLKIFDISSPTETFLVNEYDSSGITYDVYVSGDYAYIADYTGGTKVINISDKTSLKLSAVVNIYKSYGVYVSGNYIYSAAYEDGLKVSSMKSYESSGNFVSQVFDTVINNDFDLISWNSTVPSNTNLSFKVRSDNNSSMSGASDWEFCDVLDNNVDISGNNCVTDTDRYIQYSVNFLTSDVSKSPIVEDLTINYKKYPSQQSLISSPYNAESDANILAGLKWSENEILPNGAETKMYVRASTTLESLDSAGWMEVAVSSYDGTLTGGCVKSGEEIVCNESIIPESMKDGVDDQWMQYKVELLSDGSGTANVDDIVMIYVVNAAPELQSITAEQNIDGMVSISYQVRDIDGTTGTATPNYVSPSFEYWNGISWLSCSSLSDGAINNKLVDESDWSTYTLTWNPVNDFNNQYKNNTAKIRVTVNDNEAANNTVSLESNSFVLDTKDPVVNSFVIDARSDASSTLVMSVLDDTSTNLKMKISNNGDLSADGVNANSGEWVDYVSTSSWILPSNLNTIYYQFKDQYGNLSASGATSFTVFPEEPDNFVFQDVSNTETSEWREFIAWGVISDPAAGFKQYNILRSDDEENYSVISTETNRAVNYYLDLDISTGVKYYYKISVEDDLGNFSRYSEVVSDTVDGQGGSDLTSPTISNVIISDISAQSAVIKWETDELSNSSIEYIIAEDGDFTNAQSIGVTTMSDTDTGLGKHTVVVSSLIPNTTYYFQVKSSDPNRNIGVSKQGEKGYHFTTLSGPTITDINTVNISNDQATVTWETNTESDSYVVYSINADLSDSQQIGSDNSVTNHSVTINSLVAGTSYYYYVKSGVADDKNVIEGEVRYYSFTATSDNSAPTISEVLVSPVSDVLAVINWDTNELADSIVNYGIESNVYSLVASSTRMNIDHSLTLDNLTQSTTYYYKITSSDVNGNATTTEEASFLTLETLSEESDVVVREEAAREEGEANAPSSGGGGVIIIDKRDKFAPVLSNIKLENLGFDQATFSWETDEEADSYVEFGVTDEYGNTNGFRSKTMNHLVKIDDLLPSTQYYYKITSSDDSGNIAESSDLVLTTLSIGEDLINNLDRPVEEAGEENSINAGQEEESAKSLFEIANQAARRAINIIKSSASNLSFGFIEDSVKEQEGSLEELADLLPVPVMGGSPNIITSDTTVTIKWKTDRESNSLVAISPEDQYNSDLDNPYLQITGDPSSNTVNHSVTIYQLKPNTVYHYQLRNKPVFGAEARSDDFVFKTDFEVLGIKNYVIQNMSTEKAVFKWVTNSETTSSVKYTPYKDGQLDYEQSRTRNSNVLTTIHEIEVDDLEAGVSYDIELISKDESNNIITETIKSFSTADSDVSPTIDQVQTTSAIYPGKSLKIQTVISWLTNEPSTTRVLYKKGIVKPGEELKDATIKDENYAKKHIVVITKFDPGEIYSFQTESIDSGGNVSLSDIYTILTPKQEESVFQIIIKNLESVFGWVNEIN